MVEEDLSPINLRGKRKSLPADLPRIEVLHELPDHELSCACGYRKHSEDLRQIERLEPLYDLIAFQCLACQAGSNSTSRMR